MPLSVVKRFSLGELTPTVMTIQIEEDKHVPLLLIRPILETGAALIDVKKGELTLTVGDEVMSVKLIYVLSSFHKLF